MENQKKRKFKLFDLNRDGKGAKPESRKPTLGFFFKSFFRKFPNLVRLNILMIFQILPFLVFGYVIVMGSKSPSSTNILFAPLYGINTSLGLPSSSPLLDLASIQMGLPVFTPPVIILLTVLFAILVITWGWQNIGATYVLRGMVKGDAVFIFSDFFYAIKRNLKQGFLLGLIDFAISAMIIVDFLFFYPKAGESFGMGFMYVAIFALAIIYFMMRFYIYLLLVTFDLKNFKILKNAFIFSMLGIKRNIMALLGILVIAALHIALTMLLPMLVIIPIVYALAATAFMSAYAAYPIIDRYMIAPYAKNEPEDDEFVYLKEATDDTDDVADTEVSSEEK